MKQKKEEDVFEKNIVYLIRSIEDASLPVAYAFIRGVIGHYANRFSLQFVFSTISHLNLIYRRFLWWSSFKKITFLVKLSNVLKKYT